MNSLMRQNMSEYVTQLEHKMPVLGNLNRVYDVYVKNCITSLTLYIQIHTGACVHVTLLVANGMWGRAFMTLFAYWAPIPHTPRRPPIRSGYGGKPRPRGNSCRAPHQYCTGGEWDKRSWCLSFNLLISSYKLRDFLVTLARLSLHWISASSKVALTPLKEFLTAVLTNCSQLLAVEKLLLGTPRGLKFS